MRFVTPVASITLFCLTACGQDAEVGQPVTSGAHIAQQVVTPGQYHLTMTLSPTYPARVVDPNGTATGCAATGEAYVNVADANGIPDVTFAADGNVHLPVTYQAETVQYTAEGDGVVEWCGDYSAALHQTWVVTVDTASLTGLASLVYRHQCTQREEECVYTVTAERL